MKAHPCRRTPYHEGCCRLRTAAADHRICAPEGTTIAYALQKVHKPAHAPVQLQPVGDDGDRAQLLHGRHKHAERRREQVAAGGAPHMAADCSRGGSDDV